MNCLEKYLVELLQGHVTFQGRPVEVVKQFQQSRALPVITLDLSNQISTYNNERTINKDETIYYHRKAVININLWCNTEEEREAVSNSILECFYDEQNNHYQYCTRYNRETLQCDTLEKKCEALTEITSRTIKYKCPYPEKNKYQSLTIKNHLCFGTVNIEPPFELDDLSQQPILLRNIFRAEAEYYEPVKTGGQPINELTNNRIIYK